MIIRYAISTSISDDAIDKRLVFFHHRPVDMTVGGAEIRHIASEVVYTRCCRNLVVSLLLPFDGLSNSEQ